MKWLLQFAVVGILSVGSFAGCQKKGNTENPPDPPPTDLHFPKNLIIDSVSVLQLQKEMQNNSQLAATFEAIVTQPAALALQKSPQPYTSVSTTNFGSITSQAINCRLLALHWLFVYKKNPTEAKVYFEKVQSTLLAWVNIGNVALTHLPNETSYLGFYEAYSVIRSHLNPTNRTLIDTWMANRATVFRNFPPRVNNWETIRLNLLYYSGYILNNTELLSHAAASYETLLNVNLMEKGKSEDLVSRDAFAYHAYNLSFYGRILRAKAGYEGATAMEDFKAKKNNIQISLQDMVNYWRPFVVDPANNVHIEFVNTNYAPDRERSDYNQPYNPASSLYAMEELMPAFPEMKDFITAIPSAGNRQNRNLIGFLYWPD